jgi:signal transduction histidine kinase
MPIPTVERLGDEIGQTNVILRNDRTVPRPPLGADADPTTAHERAPARTLRRANGSDVASPLAEKEDLPAHGSSFRRMLPARLPRDNEVMTATLDHPVSGDWHLDLVRTWWDRLRAWDDQHQLRSDAGIAALLLVLCGVFPRFGVQRPEHAAFQAALILPLIWRRRAPTAVFCVIAMVAFVQWLVTDPLPADGALLVALFTLAVHESPRRALMGTAVMTAGVVMASVRWAPAGDVFKSFVFLTGLVVAALCTGIALRTWRSYMDAVVERTRQLESERDQQARLAATAERSRIAREMHDVVAHNVSIMVTLADGAQATADGHPAQAKEAMADVSATGRQALNDMRHLLGILRIDEEEIDRQPQPQLSGLPRLIEGVSATGLEVEFTEKGSNFELPAGVQLTIYRIVQESLTNILKHADAPSASRVTLTFDAPFVDVSVCNDGKVVDSRPEGHGIGGMRERAAISGGVLVAGPKRDGGWEVEARVRVDQ